MVHSSLPDIKAVTRFDLFLREGLSYITGEELSLDTISENRDLISYLSNKLAQETGLDSSDIAQWISTSLKQYWAEVALKE